MRKSNRKEQRKQERKRAVLADHKRIGKKFVPPMRQLPGGFNEVSWVNRILPELIWMGVLNEVYGIRRGVELSANLARLAHEVSIEDAGGKKPLFSFASSYSQLNEDQKRRLLERLAEARILNDLRTALQGFLSLYPRSPLSFLGGTAAVAQNSERDAVKAFKAILEKHMFRTEQAPMIIQANVVYIGTLCGKVIYTNNVKPPDLDALVTAFDSEPGRRAASSVRAQVTGLTGMVLEGDEEWPRYFWNRGLEINACTIKIEENDD